MSSKCYGSVVVATEMFVVGAGMIVGRARGAMTRGLIVQKPGDFMRKIKTFLFHHMSISNCINREADYYSYQYQCNYFSKS